MTDNVESDNLNKRRIVAERSAWVESRVESAWVERCDWRHLNTRLPTSTSHTQTPNYWICKFVCNCMCVSIWKPLKQRLPKFITECMYIPERCSWAPASCYGTGAPPGNVQLSIHHKTCKVDEVSASRAHLCRNMLRQSLQTAKN